MRQEYWVTAQAGTLSRKAAIMNAYHAAYGARTPAVKVAGKTVAEFPLIAREWDPTNDGVRFPHQRVEEREWIGFVSPIRPIAGRARALANL